VQLAAQLLGSDHVDLDVTRVLCGQPLGLVDVGGVVLGHGGRDEHEPRRAEPAGRFPGAGRYPDARILADRVPDLRRRQLLSNRGSQQITLLSLLNA
jgi:hypothetical protein